MHGLQEIIYANNEVARKHKARALRKRAERAQEIIASRLARSRGVIPLTVSNCRTNH
jgi:hypothetical protein